MSAERSSYLEEVSRKVGSDRNNVEIAYPTRHYVIAILSFACDEN
ncbi:hypothetical protein [Nostoc sp. CALU 1950]